MKLQTFDYISKFQLEISFIKQKLSEVISQGSSGSVVKDVGIRYSMEVPGSNSGNFFSTFFVPHSDCSIRVSRSHDFILA